MSKRDSTNMAEEIDADRAVGIAESMREDFLGLIAIVDGQLATRLNTSAGIAEARTAAERGLKLSEELVELLRRAKDAAFEEPESARGFR